MAEDAKRRAIPGQAESWTISDDGLRLHLQDLRDGIQWSDGAPVARRASSSSPSSACSTPRPRPTTLTCSTRSRTASEIADGAMAPISARLRREGDRRQDARDHPRRPDPFFLQRAHPLHRLSRAASTSSRPSRRPVDQGREHRRPTACSRIIEWVPGSYIKSREVRHVLRRRTTSRSTRSTTTCRTTWPAALNRYRAGELRHPDRPPGRPAASSCKDKLPGQGYFDAVPGHLLLPCSTRRGAAGQRQRPQGAVDLDQLRDVDRARTCWAPASCRPMAGCRPAPRNYEGVSRICRTGSKRALRPARRREAKELMEDAGLYRRQPAEAAAPLQHQRQPPAYRRGHLRDVGADRRQGRAVQRRDPGALRRPARR